MSLRARTRFRPAAAVTAVAMVFSLSFASSLVAAEQPTAEQQTVVGISKVSVVELAPLKAPVTSFGAAIAEGHLYVYGGHLGTTHKYSSETQSKQLLRLDLSKPSAAWEVVAAGPGRTGLSMVAHGGKLYRIGGWEAKNAAGEESQLYSSRDLARFDPKLGAWQDLAPLPTGRSSHDSALLGSQLYVIGGWDMQGGDGEYHTTAYVCDLAAAAPQWQKIATPPFCRRALAVAAWQGKIFAIGGTDDANDSTTATSIYDPLTKMWTVGPNLPGKPIDGFSPSAFGTSTGLYATNGAGSLLRLSADGKSWQEVGKLNHPRIAHRLLAKDDGTLVAVGGAARGGGKVPEVEAIQVTDARK